LWRALRKVFRRREAASYVLLPNKFLAITACVLFIGSLTAYYYIAESGFNPNPQQTTLLGHAICSPSAQQCPGFSVNNASLRVLNLTDVISQQISFVATAKATTSMALVKVYLDNVSLGVVEGPFAPGAPKLVSLAVPTTIAVSAGQSYGVVVEGVYTDSSGAVTAEYWQAFDVVASR
jgi:hypothetical protein